MSLEKQMAEYQRRFKRNWFAFFLTDAGIKTLVEKYSKDGVLQAFESVAKKSGAGEHLIKVRKSMFSEIVKRI
jgi:uncharacterized membrane protein